MPKLLFRGSHSEDRGSARKEVAAAVAPSVGGSVEMLCFTFGPHDSSIICDLPHHSVAAEAGT